MTELLPCPFCGSKTGLQLADTGAHWVTCDCDAEGPTADTEADAIAKWNVRHPAQEERPSEPVAWIVEGPDDRTFPRLYHTKAEADFIVKYVSVAPAAAARPLYASPVPSEAPSATEPVGMREALKECQELLAILVDPKGNPGVSSMHIWAQATAAEFRARNLLSAHPAPAQQPVTQEEHRWPSDNMTQSERLAEESAQPQAAGGEDRKALAEVVHSSLTFASHAAGEGIFFDDLDPAVFLSRYCEQVGTDDYDGIAEVARATIASPPPSPGATATKRQPIETAPKDGTRILVQLKNPLPVEGREDLERWHGVPFVARHYGVAKDGFDIGWQFAAPVGQGGFPDKWIAGWWPLPEAPSKEEAAR